MKTIGMFLTVFALLIFIVLIIWAGVCWYQMKLNCKDYLKLAGDAPTIERANFFLEKAIGHMEHRGLLQGNSAVVFRTPANDIGIWYSQIKGANDTLIKIIKKNRETSQLEKDNALMKIREVLLDQDKAGSKVTTPSNISIFPFQILFWFVFWFATIILLAGIVILLSGSI